MAQSSLMLTTVCLIGASFCLSVNAFYIPGLGYSSLRIAGGQPAKIEEYPFMAAIYKGSEFICPGAILSANYVITSASCAKQISDDKESKYTISVGSSKLGNNTSVHAVDAAKPHEKYVQDKSYTQNDIGLVHTSEAISFGATSQPIGLYRGSFSRVQAKVSGWGGNSEGRMNNELQSLSVPIYLSSECNGRYHYVGKYITYEQICAGNGQQGQSGLCFKDEGTPLIINGELAGIATWYMSCASYLPDVYTWIPSHLEWIMENINQKSTNSQVADAIMRSNNVERRTRRVPYF